VLTAEVTVAVAYSPVSTSRAIMGRLGNVHPRK
jgi:hypothetical protein